MYDIKEIRTCKNFVKKTQRKKNYELLNGLKWGLFS